MRILTKDNCPACTKLKEYLTRKKIEFEECNVSEDKWWCLWYTVTKELGVPMTVPAYINDTEKIVGSDRIMAHLGVQAVEANVVDKEACDSCQ